MNRTQWDLSPALFEPKPGSETHFKTEKKPFGKSEGGEVQQEGKLAYPGPASFPNLSFSHFPLQRKMMFPGALEAPRDEGFMSFFPNHVSKINKALAARGTTFAFYFLPGSCNRLDKGEDGKR